MILQTLFLLFVFLYLELFFIYFPLFIVTIFRNTAPQVIKLFILISIFDVIVLFYITNILVFLEFFFISLSIICTFLFLNLNVSKLQMQFRPDFNSNI